MVIRFLGGVTMETWRVEIERRQFDVIIVEADSFDEALEKGQKSLYQIRTKATITATAVAKPPKGEKPVESVFD
jgi:hypothetical protein